jgi:hypothetical protein
MDLSRSVLAILRAISEATQETRGVLKTNAMGDLVELRLGTMDRGAWTYRLLSSGISGALAPTSHMLREHLRSGVNLVLCPNGIFTLSSPTALDRLPSDELNNIRNVLEVERIIDASGNSAEKYVLRLGARELLLVPFHRWKEAVAITGASPDTPTPGEVVMHPNVLNGSRLLDEAAAKREIALRFTAWEVVAEPLCSWHGPRDMVSVYLDQEGGEEDAHDAEEAAVYVFKLIAVVVYTRRWPLRRFSADDPLLDKSFGPLVQPEDVEALNGSAKHFEDFLSTPLKKRMDQRLRETGVRETVKVTTSCQRFSGTTLCRGNVFLREYATRESLGMRLYIAAAKMLGVVVGFTPWLD